MVSSLAVWVHRLTKPRGTWRPDGHLEGGGSFSSWYSNRRRRAALGSAAIVVTVSLTGCSSTSSSTEPAAHEGTSPPPLSGVTLTEVSPSATSADIGTPDSPNIAAVDPSVPSNGELLVFLPGTGGAPTCCRLLLKVAATQGFLGIGLTYPNTPSVASRCGNNLPCFGWVRQNEFDGAAPGPASSVAQDNAIDFRLRSMLSYLAHSQPNGPWARFLSGTAVDWGRVVVAGHSQGGGEAAYIGKVERAEGVIMLSSDVDSSNTSPPEPAPYLTSGHLTPLSRYIGFDHTGDPFYKKITTDWAALGLGQFGAISSVDNQPAPYKYSHQLTTSVGVPHVVVLPEHDSTAVDIETPTCAEGTPRFTPVWRYMMEVAGGIPITPSPNPC